MTCAVRAAGGELAGIYYCPHLPDDGCDCRKPKPGLLRRLERELGVLGRGRAVHRRSDQRHRSGGGASARAPMLVRTGTGAATERALGARRVDVFDDLGGGGAHAARRAVG